MAEFTLRSPLGAHEVVTPLAARKLVGQTTKVGATPGTITAAELADNGRTLVLTVDVPGGLPEALRGDLGAYSIGTDERVE